MSTSTVSREIDKHAYESFKGCYGRKNLCIHRQGAAFEPWEREHIDRLVSPSRPLRRRTILHFEFYSGIGIVDSVATCQAEVRPLSLHMKDDVCNIVRLEPSL